MTPLYLLVVVFFICLSSKHCNKYIRGKMRISDANLYFLFIICCHRSLPITSKGVKGHDETHCKILKIVRAVLSRTIIYNRSCILK